MKRINSSVHVHAREVLTHIGSISRFCLALHAVVSRLYCFNEMKSWLSQMETIEGKGEGDGEESLST
jgi:hypothetical protein